MIESKTCPHDSRESVKDFGAGIRQLARLTGVSFGTIQKL